MARQTFTAGQVLTASQVSTLQASVWSDDVRADTTTGYTLVLDDAGRQVTMSNASSSTLTVPPFASVAFAVGVRVQVIQLGAGVVTITAGAGVTLVSASASLAMVQYQTATLIKQATNTWVVQMGVGDTSTVSGDSDQIVLGVQIFS